MRCLKFTKTLFQLIESQNSTTDLIGHLLRVRRFLSQPQPGDTMNARATSRHTQQVRHTHAHTLVLGAEAEATRAPMATPVVIVVAMRARERAISLVDQIGAASDSPGSQPPTLYCESAARTLTRHTARKSLRARARADPAPDCATVRAATGKLLADC